MKRLEEPPAKERPAAWRLLSVEDHPLDTHDESPIGLRPRHQALEMSSIRQREGRVEHVSLMRKISTECFGEHAPQWGSVVGGDDTHGGATPRAENPSKLGQASRRVREEHEAKLTNHGVEGAIA